MSDSDERSPSAGTRAEPGALERGRACYRRRAWADAYQSLSLAARDAPLLGEDLEYARRAFNERGVAAVGVREIARDLGLSPGNVSYHFPTKEALMSALIEEGHAENNALAAAPLGPLDFAKVDAIIRAIMRRDLENQWVMRDYVGLLIALPALRALHEPMQRAREARVDTLIASLIAAGLIDRKRTEHALPQLRQQILTQVFFWLPAAIVAAPDRDAAESLDAHARAALALFLAYCTRAGRQQLETLLA